MSEPVMRSVSAVSMRGTEDEAARVVASALRRGLGAFGTRLNRGGWYNGPAAPLNLELIEATSGNRGGKLDGMRRWQRERSS